MTDSSMETITAKQQQQIADLLSTGKIPDCMSEVIGKFIITVQDPMPSEMRNSAEWKRLLPLATGTGSKCESERIALVMQWMWETVLPTIQPFADENGFGTEWRVMLQQRTTTAASLATAAAAAATRAAAASRAFAASLAASLATTAASRATTAAATAALDDGAAATYAASLSAVGVGFSKLEGRERAAIWRQFNPCGLLERLIAVN